MITIKRFTMKEARLQLSNIFDAVQRGEIVEIYNDRRAGKPVVCHVVAPTISYPVDGDGKPIMDVDAVMGDEQ